ncbi:Panacea domain-containing protein [Mesorhizobium caraganae]|uniref:Panacea domain-containing protein n=1 Tax=Mesorhizobium caraganae TaxID=483206 RepID=A0ABV1YSL6_9HYPH
MGAAVNWIDELAANAVYKIELSGGQRRLKEAILYVCQKSADMERFGAIKLNKILWRADFRSYFERLTPVTGRQYQRIKLGPAPVEMAPVVNEMLRDHLLRIDPRQIGPHVEARHVALVDPVLNFFSPDDLKYWDEAISHYWNMTGAETSDHSHGIAWRSRENGDPMPYQSAFFEDEPLPPAGLSRFASMAHEKGWHSD